jgi:putative ABC transport system substrate-binding protein
MIGGGTSWEGASMFDMRRREFITLIGGAAAAWPLAAHAQRATMPVIGFLFAGSAGPGMTSNVIAGFRKALAESGYVEPQTVTIEFRYAEGRYDKLAEFAADLVGRQVSVIVATPNLNAARAAQGATATIPILFMVSDDPVKLGLVATLNRPGGNATGVNYFLTELVAKRMELLRELLPRAAHFSLLVNPSATSSEASMRDAGKAGSAIGVQVEPLYS